MAKRGRDRHHVAIEQRHDRLSDGTFDLYLYVRDQDNPKQGGIGSINRDEYNVYAVEMYQDSLAFFINDTHTFTYPRIETDKEGQFPFVGKNFYLLLDMQLGGNWVGQVDPADLPVEMEIDWVRFYRKDK